MKKINLAISGCMGRMGQQLIKSSKKNKNFKLVTLTENRLVNKKFNGIKPESKKYKVILGKNKGDGISGAEFGGYQTAPISNKDFIVQIFGKNDSVQKIKNIFSLWKKN